MLHVIIKLAILLILSYLSLRLLVVCKLDFMLIFVLGYRDSAVLELDLFLFLYGKVQSLSELANTVEGIVAESSFQKEIISCACYR